MLRPRKFEAEEVVEAGELLQVWHSQACGVGVDGGARLAAHPPQALDFLAI
jgi:hypothetical protein